MKSGWMAWLWLVLALAIAGCGSSKGGSDPDAGGSGDGDSGDGDGDGDGDSVWKPRDAGPRGGGGGDAGGGDYAQQCNVLLGLRAAADLPLCTAETRGCIESCDPADSGCSDACVAADPPPAGDGVLDCEGCIFTGLFKCFADNGCPTEINNFMCCFETECLGESDSCVDEVCGDRLSAAIDCGLNNAPSCLDPLMGSADCFPDADADAGM